MRLRYLLLVIPLFLGIAVLNGLFVRASSEDQHGTILVDGRERSYALHIPKSYDNSKPAPLLIALHGRLDTGEGEERLAHFDKVSDEYGFLAAYPNGLRRSWADGRGDTPSDEDDIDDVRFIAVLIDKLAVDYQVDPKRIYAAGMSNGGFMSGRLACELSSKIAAVAIVDASLSAEVAANCQPAKPVSVMIVQGTKDPLVPLAGGAIGRNGSGGQVLSHEEAVRKWAALNKCSGAPQRNSIADRAGDGTTIEVETYSLCADGSEVRGDVVVNGGHTWPGGEQYLPAAFIGKTTRNMDGSEAIWTFLSRHAL
jgi:polyhydroxybutyrate depolymerase